MLKTIRPFLSEHITCAGNSVIITLVLLAGIFIASVACYYITKWLLHFLEKVVLRTPTEWDDDLLNPRMMRAVSQLAPAFAVRWLIPGLFGDTADSVEWLSAITSLYIVWAIVWAITILISNLYEAFLRRPHLQPYAVKGIFQMFKLLFVCIGVIVGISILIGRSPLVIIGALGASAAVLMLVFQDSILGLVASIQLTANKMLQRGDWIEAKGHDANGEVLEVTLSAVKIKNWDNSVSTIPPYSLVKGSFRNYEPMRLSGGRRVNRSIFIDINTVRFLSPDEIESLAAEGFLAGIEPADAARVVNLGLLRRYLAAWLAANPEVNHEMTSMVRQGEPTNAGLPVELYFFISDVRWVEFEGKAADIFDHVYAVVRRFGLSIFQTPAGTDLGRAASK